MKTYLSVFLLLFISSIGYSQKPPKLVESFNYTGQNIEADQVGNLYIINKEELTQLNQKGEELNRYSNKQLGDISFLDISTGEFMVTQGNSAYVDKLLQSFQPSEIIFSKKNTTLFEKRFGDKFYTYPLDDWIFAIDYSTEKLIEQFEVNSLKGFGVDHLEMAQIAAGASLHYLATTQNTNLKHINALSRIQPDKYVWLDRFTVRNLELAFSNHPSGIPLIDILDRTVSPMGARLMKKWVVLPLKYQTAIEARLDMVDWLIRNNEQASEIEMNIRQIGDLERLISKVPLGKINPREVVQLKRALEAIVPTKALLEKSENSFLQKIGDSLNPCKSIKDQIANELKIKGESKARLFESVSVIFTDFADFTKIGSNFSPNDSSGSAGVIAP